MTKIDRTLLRRALNAAVEAVPYYAVLALTTLAALYVKHSIVSYMIIGRALGRIENPDLNLIDPARTYLFSFMERLSFFRGDFLWGLLIIPALVIGAVSVIPQRWRMAATIATSFVVIAFLIMQLQAYWVVGQFISGELLYAGIRWGWQNLEQSQAYLSWIFLAKFGISLAGLIVVGLIMQSISRRISQRSHAYRAIVLSGYGVCLVIILISWVTPTESTSYHRSSLMITARAFFDFDESYVTKYDSLEPDEAMAKYRQLANSPKPVHSPDYFGQARQCDLILFVMETCPTAIFDPTGNIEHLPNLNRLKNRAFVSRNHFTTYPHTEPALFSLLTSWYPTDIRFFRNLKNLKNAPGVMHRLKQANYSTAAYVPILSYRQEAHLHRTCGISKVEAVSGDILTEKGTNTKEDMDWRTRLARDKTALENMINDISEWVGNNQRYAVMYLPQVGHAPWPEFADISSSGGTIARGKATIALQDELLGNLLTLLEKSGRLENTIILVTGDHGVRTRVEDPAFSGSIIDPYSFQVPCLLYAPTALTETVTLPRMTSHIDITPTILNLMGISDNREFEMGLAIFDERVTDRTTFFFAHRYLGADGYHKDGKYYMKNYVSDVTYTNDIFDFRNLLPLERSDSLAEMISDNIAEMIAIQRQISRLGATDIDR